MVNKMKIGFYDSGLGGIKVLKDALDMGLTGTIYFLGDLKNNPYGTKSKEQIKNIAIKNVGYLKSIGCDVVVVACNTATAVAIEDLRKKFDIPIIGIEPAVKVALDANDSKRILVLATTLTTKEEKLKNLISRYYADDRVDLVAADKIVKLVEDKDFSFIQEEVNSYIRELLNNYDLNLYSHIVLGCTHFPIIENNFRKYISDNYPNSDIQIIDGSKGLVKNLLSKVNVNDCKLDINVIITDISDAFAYRVKEVLGEKYKINLKVIDF